MTTKKTPDAFARLAAALRVLPNVGVKTATRMAYRLLENKRDGAYELVNALQEALQQVRHCSQCNTLCEGDVCALCAEENRNRHQLMIVQMPIDIAGIEAARCYSGLYFVLMGRVDPPQGQTLADEVLEKLLQRARNGVEEIIIATPFTAEGEAAAHILHHMLKALPCRISRPARGIPLGGELEFIDAGTLSQAFYSRVEI